MAVVRHMLVWGERDRMIPVAHARGAAAEMPGSWLEVFESAGHFPFNDDPQRFVAALTDFIATTEAPPVRRGPLQRLLRRRKR